MARRLLAAASSGFGGGACVGLVGWGGAQLIIPCLTGVAGLSQLAASGSSIISLSGAAVMSAATFASSGSADLQTAMLIGIPSMGGARIGVAVARRLPVDVHTLCFNGLTTVMLPVHLLIQRQRQQRGDVHGVHTGQDRNPCAETSPLGATFAAHIAFGGFAGFLSAIMGVGGGPLVMSYLTIATPLEHHLVQGTAACAVAPGMCAASLTHLWLGTVPFRVASAVTAGAALGAFGGTRAALWLSEDQLRTFYMGSLGLLGGRAFVASLSNLSSIARRWAKQKQS
eukprot:scaffold56091_cov33-Tisochrysis_lutea.AAC.1